MILCGALAAAKLDRGKLLSIALLHDRAETLLSDLPASARRLIGGDAKHDAERRAVQELFAALPQAAEYLALWDEYACASRPEARLIKGLDPVEMLAQALAGRFAPAPPITLLLHTLLPGASPPPPISCMLPLRGASPPRPRLVEPRWFPQAPSGK